MGSQGAAGGGGGIKERGAKKREKKREWRSPRCDGRNEGPRKKETSKPRQGEIEFRKRPWMIIQKNRKGIEEKNILSKTTKKRRI